MAGTAENPARPRRAPPAGTACCGPVSRSRHRRFFRSSRSAASKSARAASLVSQPQVRDAPGEVLHRAGVGPQGQMRQPTVVVRGVEVRLVAVARELLIELWRFLETEAIPEGGDLKA